jgi:excisionase family DNA binding protein
MTFSASCQPGVNFVSGSIYTAEEIAKYLRVHPYTVKRLARANKIPGFKVGGQWRFRKDEIDRWSKNKF